MHSNPEDEVIKNLLKEARTIAVVGLSPKPHRDSFKVAAYMQASGYRIIPVHPNAREVLGEKVYRSLAEIPEKVDIVNVFRRSDQVVPVVVDAVGLKPKAVWLQVGITSEEGAAIAKEHGIDMIMDRCLMLEHKRLCTNC
ncbi:CoA-binding protein [Desulforudis sp. 1088]|uniref:CoA-binding protein n=1 Tax=unclassified Candidatus Desulforudis TaxID=2635950 RepID=UPI003CE56D4A